MKVKFLALISIILLSVYGFGATQSKTDPYSSFEDEINRLDTHEKEIQKLLGRIEVLEHSFSRLHQNFEMLNKFLQESDNLKIHSSEQENVEESGAVNSNDVFEANTNINEVKKDSSLSSNEPQDKKIYNLALAALKDSKFEAAEEKFNDFIKKYPKSSLQSNAYFWYGETFFRRKKFDKAAVNYLKGYKQFPKGAKAADSLLKLALSLGELKKKQEACNMIAKLEADFPSRPAISIKRAKDAKIKFGCK